MFRQAAGGDGVNNKTSNKSPVLSFFLSRLNLECTMHTDAKFLLPKHIVM